MSKFLPLRVCLSLEGKSLKLLPFVKMDEKKKKKKHAAVSIHRADTCPNAVALTLTSLRRNHVSLTSVRHHVPDRLLLHGFYSETKKAITAGLI